MSVTLKALVQSKQAEDSQTTQYTSTGKTIIDKFTATNTSGGAVTLSVNIVASGGTAGAANRIADARSVAPSATCTFSDLVGHVLEAGGFISTIASAAASLTIRASGREIV